MELKHKALAEALERKLEGLVGNASVKFQENEEVGASQYREIAVAYLQLMAVQHVAGKRAGRLAKIFKARERFQRGRETVMLVLCIVLILCVLGLFVGRFG